MNAIPNLQQSNEAPALVASLQQYMRDNIIGQESFIDSLLIGLLADGHLLLEGAPGLAKTKAVTVLSKAITCDAQRIQFTPDLLPGDLTGTDVFHQQTSSFEFQSGPLFHNLILADEINRAPAKVQSALLEAMAERQVTVGGTTYPLPELFMVMATQNPIEQEGTYPLPEAQLDRFIMHVDIDYPAMEAERQILSLVRNEEREQPDSVAPPAISQQEILDARQQALDVHVSRALENYMLQLVFATREPERYGAELAGMIAYGASPRGTLALDRCTRVHAWLRGVEFATPTDVQAVVGKVLRHRIVLSFDAEADGLTPDQFITELLQRVPVT